MTQKNNQRKQAGVLRRLAEENIRKSEGQSQKSPAIRISEDCRLMFHELSVHQIELEAQNEELRRAQADLDFARARYFDLYDMAPVGYCTLSDKGLILEANLTAATLLGMPREALINHPFSRYVHSEDQDAFYLHHRQNLDACGSEACELRMIKQDGAIFWAYLATVTTRHKDGTSECRMVICDITDRKRTEEALRQSERKARETKNLLTLVLDTIPVRLFWKDLKSVYLGGNTVFAKDAGYSVPEELIGLDDDCMPWKDQAAMYRRDDLEVMNSGKPKLHYEEPQTTPDGGQILLSTSKVPLRDADNRIIGILGTYEDITQRKWAEEELYKMEKLESLGLLAGGIAHDFNNILMVIMGNISFAKMQIPPSENAYERLTIAESAAMQAKDLTRQFFTFAKGGAPIKDILSVANIVGRYSRFALSGTKSTCTSTIPGDLWPIDADEGQIGQALTNILINADQSMRGGGDIRIDCENTDLREDDTLPLPPGKYVKISITDQGNGISEEHLNKIFDPYFTTRGTGRGLGLASAYSIVRQHGGTIAVASIPGSGTTFTLYLPAAETRTPAATAGQPEQLFTGKGKILVMDDDEVLLQLIETMLKNLGYDVELAVDGRDALAKYAEAQHSSQPFDAVILDLTVRRGMGGRETIAHLIEMDPQARAIVSSGYSDDPAMAAYQEYGFSAVIPKPYRIEDLSAVMQQVLHP